MANKLVNVNGKFVMQRDTPTSPSRLGPTKIKEALNKTAQQKKAAQGSGSVPYASPIAKNVTMDTSPRNYGKPVTEKVQIVDYQSPIDTSPRNYGRPLTNKLHLGLYDDEKSLSNVTLGDFTYKPLLSGYYGQRMNEAIGVNRLAGNTNMNTPQIAKYQGLAQKYEPTRFNNPNAPFGGLLNSAPQGAMSLIGQQVANFTDEDTVMYAGTGASAGAMIGSVAGLPGSAISAATGFGAGIAAGVGKNMFEAVYGGTYRDLIGAGVSENTAHKTALISAGVQSAIEMAQLGELAKAAKLLRKQNKAVLAEGIEKILIDRGKGVLKNTGEEVAQEVVAMSGEHYAKSKEGLPTDSLADNVNRAVETGVNAFLSVGLISLPGAVSVGRQISKYNNANPMQRAVEIAKRTMNPQNQEVQIEQPQIAQFTPDENVKNVLASKFKSTEDVKKWAENLAQKSKFDIEFVADADASYNGYFKPYAPGESNGKQGRMVVNLHSEDPIKTVFGHELTHILEFNSKEYNEYANFAINNLVNRHYGTADITALAEQKAASYAQRGVNLSIDEAKQEIVAELTGEYLFKNEQSISDLYKYNENLFYRIYENIKNMIKSFAGTDEEKDLIKARNLYAKVLKANQKNPGVVQTAQEGDTQAAASYLFAGERAKNADKEALAKAQQMESDNADAETIWKETGWFRGPDKKWRWEIDDSQAKFSSEGRFSPVYEQRDSLQAEADRFRQEEAELQARLNEIVGEKKGLQKYRGYNESEIDMMLFESNKEYRNLEEKRMAIQSKRLDIDRKLDSKLEHYYDHPGPYDNYPGLRDTAVDTRNDENGYSGSYNERSRKITLNTSAGNEDKLGGITLHEMQHAIQNEEGFAKGASTEGPYAVDYEGYMKSAGEIEAREVQNRQNMTAQERREKLPDLGGKEAIVKFSMKDRLTLTDKGKKTIKSIVDNPYLDMDVVKAPTVELDDDEILVYRKDEDGKALKGKPQGLFTSPVIDGNAYSMHGNAGNKGMFIKAKANNVYESKQIQDVIPERGNSKTDLSAPVAALYELDNATYSDMIGMRKNEAIEYVNRNFPQVSTDRAYDSYEIMERVAAHILRERGYDSVTSINPDDPSLDEIILLNDDFEVLENEEADLGGKEAIVKFSMKNPVEQVKELKEKGALNEREDTFVPKYSLASWKATDRDKLVSILSEQLERTPEEVEKYLKSIDSVANTISKNKELLDYNANPLKTALKPNSEYTFTVDCSTLCKKRNLFAGTFDALQAEYPDHIFTSEELVELRAIMAEEGYEVPCGICYVESMRKDLGPIAAGFIKDYKGDSEGYIPNMYDLTTTKGYEEFETKHPEAYADYLKAMNARGQQKPKLVETRTDYRNEIIKLSKSKVDSLNSNGGLRLQSYSDFEIPHLIDMLQVVTDMSARGLKGQAYTKIPEFARVLGKTGLKINLSLIAKEDGYDTDGNLIFDDIEGMNHEVAFDIRKKYGENVGTILVGKNDEHIRIAMADDRIDFIIPYHRSGWKASLYDKLGLTGYMDYSKTQNEKPFVKSKAKTKNLVPNSYWDYSKSGDENSKIYLAKCKENKVTPKFPQFLEKDESGDYKAPSGYWKLLIDYKMYDNSGKGMPQAPVMPIFDNRLNQKILKEYSGGHDSYPVAGKAVEKFSAIIDGDGSKFSMKDNTGKQLSQKQQEFFKDSKVRDEDGNLQVVYHGSKQDFEAFDKGKVSTGQYGQGFYFTKNKEISDMYTGRDSNGKTYEVYLNLKNPFIFEETLDENVILSFEKAMKDVKPTKYDSPENIINSLKKKQGITDFMLRDVFRDSPENDEKYSKMISIILQKNGYDGIIVGNGDHVEYVAFEPEQIKTIDNENPTEDARMKFSMKDDKGRELTQEQAQYFKDSKVKKGKNTLLTVYHGGTVKDVFDIKSGTAWNQYGDGAYFSDSEYYADEYSSAKEGETKEYYINITHPFDLTSTLPESETRDRLESILRERYNFTDGRIRQVFNNDAHYVIRRYLEGLREKGDRNDPTNDILQEAGYDGIIAELNDGYQYVIFNSNQAKLTHNLNPTDSKNTQFSLKEPVEKTKDLIAAHNLTIDNMMKTLDLGGLPAASIAVAKADMGHSEFGEISVLFYPDTIDGKKNKANKVFAGDAWTQTFPQISQKVSKQAHERLEKRINSLLAGYDNYKDLGYLNLSYDGVQGEIDRWDSFESAYSNSYLMKLAYLRDTGKEFKPVMMEKNFIEDKPVMKAMLQIIGADKAKEWMDKDEMMPYEPQIREAINKYYESVSPGMTRYDEPMTWAEMDGTVNSLRRYAYYIEDGSPKVIDTYKTKDKLKKVVNEKAYTKWLESISEDLIEKQGIRNSKDLYTNNGRRTWDQLHDDATLDNITRAMTSKDLTGNAFGGGTKFAAGVKKQLGSISDIRKNKDLIKDVSDEEIEAIRDDIDRRLIELVDKVSSNDSDSLFARDGVIDSLLDAALKGKTRDGIKRRLMATQYGNIDKSKLTDKVVDDFVQLIQDAQAVPTRYFEAKPQRAIGLDEIAMVVIPRKGTKELRAALDARGINYKMYDGTAEDRIEKINGVPNVKFSLKKADAKNIARKIKADYGSKTTIKDIAQELTEIYDMDANDMMAVNQRIEDLSARIAESVPTINEFEQRIKEFRTFVRKMPIKVDDNIKADIADFGAWSKRYFNRLNLKTDGRNIDELYGSLAEQFPEFLDADIANPSDQLIAIAEALDTTRQDKGYGNNEGMIYDIILDIYDDYYRYQADEQAKAAEEPEMEPGDDGPGNNGPTDDGDPYGDYEGDTSLSRTDAWEHTESEDRSPYFEKGEKPARDINVPQRDEYGRKVSRFTRTAAESRALDDKQASELNESVWNGTFSYNVITDQDAINRANDKMERFDNDTLLNGLESKLYDSKIITKDDIALGERLIQEYAKEKNIDSLERAIAVVATAGTRAGQAVQAMRLLKKLSPAGQLMALQKQIDSINTDMKLLGDNKVTLSPERAKDIASSDTPEGLEQAVERAKMELYNKVPSRWVDKWNAWRYLSMLGNPKTHIRNVLGNAIFVPVRGMKNVIGATIEAATVKGERSKAIGKLPKVFKEFAAKEFDANREAIDAGGKENIERNKRVFKSSLLEGMRKANSFALEAEDQKFLKAAYVRSFAGYLKANKISPAIASAAMNGAGDPVVDIKTSKIIENARAYAMNEAQKATYRDYSALANALNKFKKTNAATAVLGEGLMPFTKTPINILKRGVEYSPVGILKGIKELANDVRKADDDMKQQTILKGIDSMASGLSGTAILALGAFLASQGILSGGGEDDKKERDMAAMMGSQNYSFNMGDVSYTVDWMAPVSLPLFVGVELFNSLESGTVNGFVDIADAMTSISEPMVNMSMLQGLNRAVTNFDQKGALTSTAADMALGYFSQGVPTLGGQIARTMDATRRTAYVDKNNDIPDTLERPMLNAAAKVPGLSKKLNPYRDSFGRPQTNDSALMRAFENFISPGYVKVKKDDRVLSELQKVYEKTGDKGVLPSLPNKKIGDKNLTAKEYDRMAYIKGKESYELIDDMRLSSEFKSMPDADQAKMISDAYSYAYAMAKDDVLGVKPDGWIAKAADAEQNHDIPVETYITYNNYKNSLKGEGTKAKFIDKIQSDESLTQKQKDKLDDYWYGSVEASKITELSNAEQRQWNVAKNYGFDEDKFSKYVGYITQQGEGKTKMNNINDAVKAGLPRGEAVLLYNIMRKKAYRYNS